MKSGLRNTTLWTAAVIVAVAPSALRAQEPVGPSAPQAQAIERYVVGQAKPPETPGSPMVDLTLDRAIQIALEKNLDLQVARINPILQDFSLKSLRAAYLPQFSSSFRHTNSQSPVTNIAVDGGLRTNISTNQNYSVGMSQQMPWYGGSMNLSFSSGRNATNNPNQPQNPQLSAGFSASYSQPLLANFRIDGTRNNLRTATITRQINDITLQNSIENTKASVRTAYWSLRQAIERIEIQRRALELAQRQFTESQQKVEIGTMAPIDTTNFETAVATAEQSLLNATIQWRTAELNFKRLLVSGAGDPLYGSTLNPIDQPIFAQQAVDLDAAVQNALAQRTDLETNRRQLHISELNLELTRGATLPSLNLTGGYSMSGTGGPTVRNGVVTIPGGYFDAITSMTDRPSWNVGLNFSYPLGMVSAKANLARAELQLEQSKAQQKVLELTITADVTQAGLNVSNTYLQLQSARKSREAQERNADAAQTRFSVGLANPFEVAQALQSLTSARLNELSAVISYLNAVADFEKRQRVGG